MIIDNLEFVAKHQENHGKLELGKCSRTIDILDELEGTVHYRLRGFTNELNQPTLKVSIYGTITTLCQICLKKFEVPININRIIQIFKSESDLDAALFGENSNIEDGILADTEFNVVEFIEDELIMSIPVAPKHETCVAHSYHDKINSPFSELKKMIN